MVGAGSGRVKAAAALLLLGACSWRSYGRMAATHVEVLTATAAKGADLVASGRLTAESLPELTYPLERAQDFARTVRRRAPRQSSQAFEVLLARYAAFLDTLDRVRREHRGEAARAALASPLAEVQSAGAAVLDALRAEHAL